MECSSMHHKDSMLSLFLELEGLHACWSSFFFFFSLFNSVLAAP